MRGLATHAGRAVLLSGAVGCGAGEDLSLGRDAPLDAKLCTASAERELQVAFYVSLGEVVCPDGDICAVEPMEIKAAPDGSAWVLGRVESSWIPWLGHFAPDGTLLGATEVANPTRRELRELAVDDESQAWIPVAQEDPKTLILSTNLQRYDAAARSLGAPIAFDDGVARLARIPGRGMALTGSRNLKFLGPRGGWGRPVESWDEPAPPANGAGLIARSNWFQIVSAPAATGAAQIALSSWVQIRGANQVTLQVYKADGGEHVWNHLIPPEFTGYSFHPDYAIEGDIGGNLTVENYDGRRAGSSLGALCKIRAGGEPHWLWSPNVNGNTGFNSFAVEYDTGRVFVGGAALPADAEGRWKIIIQEISADGEVCRTYAHRGAPQPINGPSVTGLPLTGDEGIPLTLQRLSLSPTGELFFVTRTSVGRFTRIEP